MVVRLDREKIEKMKTVQIARHVTEEPNFPNIKQVDSPKIEESEKPTNENSTPGEPKSETKADEKPPIVKEATEKIQVKEVVAK